MPDVADLRVKISLDGADKVSSGLQKTNSDVQSFAATAGKLGGGVASVARELAGFGVVAGGVVAAGFGAAIGKAKDFEGSISDVGALVNATTPQIQQLSSAAQSAMASLVSAVSGGISQAVALIASLPGQAAAAVGNLAGVLFNAGASLIGGFIAGIQSRIGEIAGVLAGVTNMLPELKGPPEKDAVILFESGQLVMQGFINGISDKELDLRKKLADVTSSVAKSVIDALAALRALSGFRGGPGEAQLSSFFASLSDFMERFTTAVGAFEEDVLKQAGQFSDAASKATGLIKNAVDGLDLLSSFRAPLESAVSEFLASLADFMERFSTVAGGFEDDVLKQAGQFASQKEAASPSNVIPFRPRQRRAERRAAA